MADSTDSTPLPNVPSRVASLRPSMNSGSHPVLSSQDSFTGKGGPGKKKKNEKGGSKLVFKITLFYFQVSS